LSLGCARIEQTGGGGGGDDPVPQKFSGDFTGCYTGAFTNGNDYISGFESATGRKLAVVMWFKSFAQDFPSLECSQVWARGSVPCITWEPWKGSVPDSDYTLQKIADGEFDAYISKWALDAKAFGHPFFLRFAHEMNGNWYPWDGAHNGLSEAPAKYIAAWKHVHGLFNAAGVLNVTWVWSVISESVPDETWNSIGNYYPGDAYVDWIGIDGYNWGGSAWQTFDQIFSSVYSQIRSSYPLKPVMIGEFASAPDGGDKAAWITDAFSKIKSNYSGIKLFNWFNITKERDWTVADSASYETAYKAAVAETSYFLDNVVLPSASH